MKMASSGEFSELFYFYFFVFYLSFSLHHSPVCSIFLLVSVFSFFPFPSLFLFLTFSPSLSLFFLPLSFHFISFFSLFLLILSYFSLSCFSLSLFSSFSLFLSLSHLDWDIETFQDAVEFIRAVLHRHLRLSTPSN